MQIDKQAYKISSLVLHSLVLVAGLSSQIFASDGVPLKSDALDAETWGADTHVVQYDRFYIAGQPDQGALETAAASGVDIIITLRSPTESDWDEAAAAESLGMSYYQVPVDGSAPELAAEPLNRVSQIVQSNPDEKILVHCSSSNRASAWFAVYLSEVLGVEQEEAIQLANQTGLTSAGLEEKVRVYLDN